ncbi:MAG: class I SAM-dependent methyltransferase [Alistipes sp.]|nr:class I SAM-dependent methyltransferase [Candidatus Minthomonas equi]
MILEAPSNNWKDYELIDSGNFEKLERFGSFVLARPEPKALWDRKLSEGEWRKMAHTRFTPGAGFGKAGKEDSGTWNILKPMPENWNISYQGGPVSPSLHFNLRLGLTSFKHVGVFPEQSPNWDFIYSQISRLRGMGTLDGEDTLAAGGDAFASLPPVTRVNRRPKVLNLFAYTGAASVAACAAGADVTHLDSVRQVVTWAHGNMEKSGLDGIRWIVEDALKFVRREARRGNLYDGIMLDPPAYGHGPDGERWKLDECLNDLLKECARILSPMDSFLVLNLYSNGYSAMLADTLTGCAFGSSGRRVSGELLLKDRFGRMLPLSVFTRLVR